MQTGRSKSFCRSDGYALIIVLVAMAFISSLSLLLVQYGQWQAQVQHVGSDLQKISQAQKMASGWSEYYLKETLADSDIINGTIEREWTLPPNLKIKAELVSLNDKINLNRLRKDDTSETFRELVVSLLEEMNYPNRVKRTLIQWMQKEGDKPGSSTNRYGGYKYSAPKRKILHLDELNLISGFKEIGLSEELLETFTVHGSGNVNPLHFTPEKWERYESALGPDFPSLPQAALQNSQTLRNYLKQEQVWSDISSEFDFFTNKDDSFRITYYFNLNGTIKRSEEIYLYNSDSEETKLSTRYILDESDAQIN